MNRHDKDLEQRDQKSGLNRKESEFGETSCQPDEMYRGSTGTISEEDTKRERDSESEIEIDVDRERERMTGREYSVEH